MARLDEMQPEIDDFWDAYHYIPLVQDAVRMVAGKKEKRITELSPAEYTEALEEALLAVCRHNQGLRAKMQEHVETHPANLKIDS